MTLATIPGKDRAFAALAKRCNINKTRKRIDNSSLYAGSPMHFDCSCCGADIMVPENYIIRPKLCDECEVLKNRGWLE